MSFKSTPFTRRDQHGPGPNRVKAVSVTSTGTMQTRTRHAFARRIPTDVCMFASRGRTPPRPVSASVIQHLDGVVLSDRAAITDLKFFPAPFAAADDAMGDGTSMLLATPEHPPGSTSRFIRRASCAPVLLVGDATYATESLEARGMLRANPAEELGS
jgi:hypothetical protein